MIEFTTVSREFRGLVERRRELFTFLGSVFAAMGLFLQNTLQGGLPEALASIQQHIFAFYALVLMVLSLILALRMAKLHGGMVLNGILYARLMQEQDFTRKGDPVRAGRHNWFGVSFLQFILVDLIASFSATILALALFSPFWPAFCWGAGVFVLWVLLYFRFHHQARTFAFRKIAAEPCAPFNRNEWEGHVSGSLQQANQGLIGEIAFTGLMVFSVFEALSGLGRIKAGDTDLATDLVKSHGPIVYAILMVVTCLLELIIYLRIRVAAGAFCVQLDPTDQPFRPLRLTDSLLGYLVLAFLFAVSLHILLILLPSELTFLGTELQLRQPALVGIDAAAIALAVSAEQITLIVVGRRWRQR
jgi:hypothetical protein